MQVNDYIDLNETHRDVLQELGNIGTGNALTALSQLTDRPIQMGLPGIRIIDKSNLSDIMENQDDVDAGVMLLVKGDLECVVTFLLNGEFTSLIVEDLTGEPLTKFPELSDMQESAICEIGNIMCNAYLNALAAMLGTILDVSLPHLEVGTPVQLLNLFSEYYKDEKAEVLLIENAFFYEEHQVVSHILLHPKYESLNKILESLEG